MAKVNILFVEDSEAHGTTTKDVLEKRGHAVTWVLDGMSALRLAMTQPFDIILLDRILPDMDGNELCRWLKHNQDTRGIPIIMISAKDTTTDKVQGLDSGADDYLSKPYEEVELNARVNAALRIRLLQDELQKKNDELKEMLTQVVTLSNSDPLTGLLNRRRFDAILQPEFSNAMRYKTPLSCMMIDIDHFKVVNDTYGHAIGDAVIKDVAGIIKSSIRDVDTACRWGGEEFIVLTPMTPQANAELLAQRILKSVSEHVFAGINSAQLTVSIGIADVSGSGIDSVNKLIQAADIALFRAKKKGRNRIEVGA
jgi:two-component system, cell cycle response regulator